MYNTSIQSPAVGLVWLTETLQLKEPETQHCASRLHLLVLHKQEINIKIKIILNQFKQPQLVLFAIRNLPENEEVLHEYGAGKNSSLPPPVPHSTACPDTELLNDKDRYGHIDCKSKQTPAS